ncbi:hypothetical protein KGM_211833 [Danaus plexippus plexippus]|uniref:Uncharacterized protein n=1 Tax=Danaus plexippus plexippus TaxID=278856 RepID=A0A212FPX5_DANPL|nr:hypothetical protein KGM_211833 [Danaus plexippus plexippus]
MCGAWRPEEVDGGHIFVLEKRDPGMSPDPMREEDFPENIEDFWEASFANIDIDQLFFGTLLLEFRDSLRRPKQDKRTRPS